MNRKWTLFVAFLVVLLFLVVTMQACIFKFNVVFGPPGLFTTPENTQEVHALQ